MVNKPRSKGTSAETAVVTYLRDHGWPFAERRSLNGATDKGDVTGCPGLCFEVKYANAGLRLAEWLEETKVETTNAKADYGVLVVKPRGLGDTRVRQWYAVMDNAQFQQLTTLPRGQSLYIVHGPPTAFTAGRLREQIAETPSNGIDASHLLALTLKPPGTKDTPDEWYRVMVLEQMVLLLRAVGYGSPALQRMGEFDGDATPTRI